MQFVAITTLSNNLAPDILNTGHHSSQKQTKTTFAGLETIDLLDMITSMDLPQDIIRSL